MSIDQTYNGWTNRATWLVPLWIDNDQGSYNIKCERLAETKFVTPEIAKSIAWECLGIEDGRERLTPDHEHQGGHHGHRSCDVDWADIAESWETERQEIEEYAGGAA